MAARMAMINCKCLNPAAPKMVTASKPTLSLPPKGLTSTTMPSCIAGSALAASQIAKIAEGDNSKGIIIGLGLAASGMVLSTPEASANEIAMIADAAASSDNRGQLLLLVVTPAIVWVLYNILQPALNQLNRMRSK